MESLFEFLPNDEHYPGKTGPGRVGHHEVQKGLPLRPNRLELFEAPIARGHSGGEKGECGFHGP